MISVAKNVCQQKVNKQASGKCTVIGKPYLVGQFLIFNCVENGIFVNIANHQITGKHCSFTVKIGTCSAIFNESWCCNTQPCELSIVNRGIHTW